MTTYPEMNEQIVDILRFRGDSPSLYAAGRIEELEIEAERLLEQAQRAEAETQEWHDYADWFGNILRGEGFTFSANEDGDLVNTHNPTRALKTKLARAEAEAQRYHIVEDSQACADYIQGLQERLAQTEGQVADLRGALQAALTPLEAAADALASPAWPEEAAALVEEALVAIREELE